MADESLHGTFTSIRWVNEYTAVAEVADDSSVSVGEEFTIPTRAVPVDSWRDHRRIRLNKLLTPPGEYHNIHLEKDSVLVNTTSVSESGQECALEMVVTGKYYGTGSLADAIR